MMNRLLSLSLAALAGATLAGGVGFAVTTTTPPPAAAPARAEPAAPTGPAPLTLPPERRAAAGVTIGTAEQRSLTTRERVPGLVQANQYQSALVSSRIAAVVQQRHARLGQSVQAGQALATLFSAEVADAQAAFLLAEQEWRRVRDLGRDVVAGRRWAEAEIGRQNARARLLTFGLSPGQIETLTREGQVRAPGLFTVTAPQAGTLTQDSFRIGERIEAGRPLFEISDPGSVWVEARLPPTLAATTAPGRPARVLAGDRTLAAEVRQILPTLDEQTRTLGVRLEVANRDHQLTPGQFVQVEIIGPAHESVVVPASALARTPEGQTMLFVASAEDHFTPVMVTVTRSAEGLAAIEGLAPGTRLATAGVFLLQSELARTAGASAP